MIFVKKSQIKNLVSYLINCIKKTRGQVVWKDVKVISMDKSSTSQHHRVVVLPSKWFQSQVLLAFRGINLSTWRYMSMQKIFHSKNEILEKENEVLHTLADFVIMFNFFCYYLAGKPTIRSGNCFHTLKANSISSVVMMALSSKESMGGVE